MLKNISLRTKLYIEKREQMMNVEETCWYIEKHRNVEVLLAW